MKPGSYPRSHYWQLLPYIKTEWRTILQGFVGIVGYVIATLWLISLAGKLALPFGQGNMLAIAKLTSICALVFLLRGIFQAMQDLFMAKAALKVAFLLRQQVFIKLQNLHLGYFETAKTGDLTYRLTEDVDRIGEVVNKLFHDFVPCVLQLIAIPIYMIYLNWQLTLATAIVAPLMGILIGWFGERLLKYSRKSQNQVSDLSAILTEVFSGIRLIKAFAAEEYEIARFSREADRSMQAKYALNGSRRFKFPLSDF